MFHRAEADLMAAKIEKKVLNDDGGSGYLYLE